MKQRILLSALILTMCMTGCGVNKETDSSTYSQEVTVTEEPVEESITAPVTEPTEEPVAETEPTKNVLEDIVFSKSLDIHNISDGKYVRSCAEKGNLSELGSDEFFSFSLCIANKRDKGFAWECAEVVVDDGETWYWGAGEIPAGGGARFPLDFLKMSMCMAEGEHTVAWSFDGQEVYRDTFVITRDMYWPAVFEVPSEQEIADYKNPDDRFAPCVSGWLSIPQEVRYSEYSVEFKADYIPNATYCCLGQWSLDYSALEKEYHTVLTEYVGVHSYGGFQNTDEGMVSILAFWDVYCQDETGNLITIRAKRVYPETVSNSEDFGGEGTGAHCLMPYEWEANHWYRMHMKCVESQDTGNTTIEQWVCDLETEEWTLLCIYDLGVKDVTFMSAPAIFLENYLTEYAGEVRSMELRNIKYLDAESHKWENVTSAYMESNGGAPTYEGSYNFGTFQDRFWMITSGVGGDWFNNGKGREAETLFVEE